MRHGHERAQQRLAIPQPGRREAAHAMQREIAASSLGKKIVMKVALLGATGFVGSALLSEALKPGSRATSEALGMLRNEPELEWSLLAPSATLESGERTAAFRLGGGQLLVDAKGESRVSVQDYAVAMIDELEGPAHIRQQFTVGY
jgi:putative NADH-flavin reductase